MPIKHAESFAPDRPVYVIHGGALVSTGPLIPQPLMARLGIDSDGSIPKAKRSEAKKG